MSKKNLTQGMNPLASLGKSSKKGKNKQTIKQLDQFIAKDESQISAEQSSQEIQPRRLKKLRKMNQQNNQKLIEKKKVSQHNSVSQEEQQSQQLAENQYERFGRVDDQDIKKMQDQKNNKKGKKKLKKGEQQIDKFVEKHPIQQKKKNQPVKPTKSVQLNLQAMFQSSSQPKKIQPTYSNTKMEEEHNNKSESDSDSDQSEDDLQIYRRKQAMMKAQLNSGLSDEAAMELAIAQSLKDVKQKEPQHVPLDSYSYNKNKNPVHQLMSKGVHKKQQPKKQQPKHKQAAEPKKQQRKRSKSKSQEKKKTDKKGVLAGLGIVLTGQFQPYSKNKILEVLQQLGADHPKSITKKTTHLLQGCYCINNFGRRTDQDVRTTTKSQQAAQKNIKIIPFENLDDFFIEKTGKTLEQLIEKDKPKSKPSMDNYIDINKTQSAAKTDVNRNDYMMEEPNQTQRIYQSISQPWTQKYKPKSSQQIIGQTSQLKSLRQWLQVWQDIHIRGNKRDVKPNFNTFMPSGTINSNAALLSGDAGLGKTTAARLIASQFGYSIVQYNASDARNKKSVQLISMGKNNLSFLKNKDKQMTKTLIIMDQVDGMSSGDRGGIAAIIDMIKKTRVPIICICNDRQATKIRSLAGHCYDIKFHKPDKRIIAKRLQKIIQAQGGTATIIGLQNLVQLLNNDIRQILTYLQVIFKSGTKNITSQVIQKRCTQKDSSLSINHFQATKMLLTRTIFKGMKISQRVELSFVDSDMVPLMIQQNYLSACPKKKMNAKQFKKLAKASQGFVLADLIDRSIMRSQNYCLMPNKMFLSCVYPCELICESMGFPKFTQWLGKFSTQRKNRRLIKQLKYSIACATPVTTFSVKNHFVPMLMQRIVNMLKTSDPDIDAIIQFMWHYNITPAILSQHLSLLQYGQRQQLLKSIETSKKTKLTKTYNKKCQTTKFKKQKTKATTGEHHLKFDPVLEQMQDQNDEPSQHDNQQNDEQSGVQIQVKKGAKSKPKPKKK